MKTLLLFLLLPLLAIAQDKNLPTNVKSEVIEAEVKILAAQVDSLKSAQQLVRDYDQRMALASETIASFDTFHTSLGILIGLFTIGITFLTYIFGIKPSQDAVKNLEKTIEAKHQTLFQQQLDNNKELAIKFIEEGSTEEFTKGLHYISTSALTITLSKLDLFRILNACADKRRDIDLRYGIISILAHFNTDDLIHNFFVRELDDLNGWNEVGGLRQVAYDYYLKPDNQPKGIELLKKHFATTATQTREIIDVVSYFSGKNKFVFVHSLLNDDKVISRLKKLTQQEESEVLTKELLIEIIGQHFGEKVKQIKYFKTV